MEDQRFLIYIKITSVERKGEDVMFYYCWDPKRGKLDTIDIDQKHMNMEYILAIVRTLIIKRQGDMIIDFLDIVRMHHLRHCFIKFSLDHSRFSRLPFGCSWCQRKSCGLRTKSITLIFVILRDSPTTWNRWVTLNDITSKVAYLDNLRIS